MPRFQRVVRVIYDSEEVNDKKSWEKVVADKDLYVSEIIRNSISGDIESLVLKKRNFGMGR